MLSGVASPTGQKDFLWSGWRMLTLGHALGK